MKTMYRTFDAFGHPYENIPFADYSALAAYELKPMERELRLQALTVGIPAAHDFMERFLTEHTVMEAVTYTEMRANNVVRSLLFHAMIQCFYDKSDTYGNLKMALIEMNNAIHSYRKMFRISDDPSVTSPDLRISAYIQCLMQTLRADQMENKALETSVITGCAPIVPYTGTIRKPFAGERMEKPKYPEIDPMDEMDPEDKDLLKWFSTLEQTIERTDIDEEVNSYIAFNALMDMESILEHPTSAASVMYFHDMFREIKSFNEQDFLALVHNVRMSRQDPEMRSCGLHTALLYYGYAYVATNFFNVDKEAADKMIAFFQDVSRFYLADAEKEEFSKVFQNIYNALPASESALLSDMEKIDALERFTKNPENYSLADTEKDPMDLFDLTPLMNYIYTARRFRTNSYTRTAFMDLPSIGGYTFYRGWLIIVPQTPEGQELNYLYIPVIDDLNGSQVAIIKYWRNSHIDILTENQYQKEIMG